MANCPICGKELVGWQKYSCSNNKCKCRVYYRKNKEMFVQKAREWSLKNPEKRKVSLKKALTKYFKSQKGKDKIKELYEKHKVQWKCNALTRRVLKKIVKSKRWSKRKKEFVIYTWKPKQIIFLKRICKVCGSRKNLELHHEKYSPTTDEIRKDIKNGLIYYLCRKHHRTLNGIHYQKISQENPSS